MCCLRSTKQRGTLTEYLSTFFGFELFPCPKRFTPQGPFYEGSRWVLDILLPKTTQIFRERGGCEVRGLFWHQLRAGHSHSTICPKDFAMKELSKIAPDDIKRLGAGRIGPFA